MLYNQLPPEFSCYREFYSFYLRLSNYRQRLKDMFVYTSPPPPPKIVMEASAIPPKEINFSPQYMITVSWLEEELLRELYGDNQTRIELTLKWLARTGQYQEIANYLNE